MTAVRDEAIAIYGRSLPSDSKNDVESLLRIATSIYTCMSSNSSVSSSETNQSQKGESPDAIAETVAASASQTPETTETPETAETAETAETPETSETSKTPATSEDSPSEPSENEDSSTESTPPVDPNAQVRFKTEEDGRLLLILPPESDKKEENAPVAVTWNEICQQLQHRLNAGDRFWQANTSVNLLAFDRLLDARQLQTISEALADAKLQLARIYTTRRQTAVAAATAGYSVEQKAMPSAFQAGTSAEGKALADPLYLETTVRSGLEIRHPGHIIVNGDVNPGGTLIADGDILVWGRLRGIAHAGANGNHRASIMALEMEPTQIRIADFVARAPETPSQFYPEVAYVSPQGIRIARAVDFSKAQFLSQ
ncbi:septum site-determining protein MinC [Oxynema aestuarii]|nr:septum site-determining protein MinC [Oxynema aestuarii]